MSKPNIGDELLVSFHNIGMHGEGVGSYEGFTIFTHGVLPGELAKVRMIECHKRYGHAELLEIFNYSPDRVSPLCPVFHKCGGCQIMHLSYEKQLDLKQQRVLDALERIAKMKDLEVLPCEPSPHPFYYRNKIQLPVKNGPDGIIFGLYAKGSHKIVEIDKCFIHCGIGEETFQAAKTIIQVSGIVAHEPKNGIGELRHLLIKSSLHCEEALVILVTNTKPSTKLKAIAKELLNLKIIKGVIHNENGREDNVILGSRYTLLEGQNYIHEILCKTKFKVSPSSFFQVNPEQAERLYSKVLDWAEIQGDEIVLDAYCGVGTLALLFAERTKKVIGIECVSEAIEDAKINAQLNDLSNASFVCAQAEKYIDTLLKIDIAVLNPPRKGCESSFLQRIGKLQPRKILYVSCNPSTLARDLVQLCSYGYTVTGVQPFDMFPQTSHVECLVRLSKQI